MAETNEIQEIKVELREVRRGIEELIRNQTAIQVQLANDRGDFNVELTRLAGQLSVKMAETEGREGATNTRVSIIWAMAGALGAAVGLALIAKLMKLI